MTSPELQSSTGGVNVFENGGHSTDDLSIRTFNPHGMEDVGHVKDFDESIFTNSLEKADGLRIRDFVQLPTFRRATEGQEQKSRTWNDVEVKRDPETGHGEITLESGKDADVLNAVPPPADTTLHIEDRDGNNYTDVTTDDRGRIVTVERPTIEIVDQDERQRDPVQTGKTFEQKDGLRDEDGKRMDDGGHIVADEFGGSSEQTNLLPMDSEVNRHGEWRDMEKTIEGELKKEPPSKVTDYKVEVKYADDSSRPSGFVVSFNVDGEPYQYVIVNERQEKDVRDAA